MKKIAAISVVGLFLSWPCFAGKLSLAEFQEKMQKHIAALSKKTTVSVYMETLGTNRALFSYNENEALIPASNTKLITTAAALEKLGSGFTFNTKVVQQGNDLVLLGNGDPYLVSERLWLLARDVARSGIKNVNAIRVNNSAFTENYRGLMAFEDSGEPFTAMVSATSLNFNSLEVHVVPQAGKSKPRIEVGPVNHVYAILQNEVTQTSGSGKNLSVKPVRVAGNQEVFRVTGSIGRQAAPVTIYATVSMPEAHIASAFAALLRNEGITVGKDYGGTSQSPTEGNGIVLASQDSLPLRELVGLFNTFSNNFMAEQVFQALGNSTSDGPLSVGKSQKAVMEFLRGRNSCAESSMENGSGLSWNTRLSARCLVETLQIGYRDFQVFADLVSSLPVGGQVGTLKSRFKRNGNGFLGANVRAKTGTLWSKQVVTSLAGVTATANGEKVLFAFLENDQRNDPGLLRELKDWEDKCLELVQQLQI